VSNGGLADKSDGEKIIIQIDGCAAAGYEPNWLQNAVVIAVLKVR